MSNKGDHHLSETNTARLWVLTDGKIGDDVQCLAVAEALAPAFDKRVIAPRAPWEWMAPWGPIDPRDAVSNPNSPIFTHGESWPDVVIASGRRAIPYARAIKRASRGNAFVVVMKDPRIDPAYADLVWAPAHDRLDGANVISTLTSPHGLASRIEAARDNPSGPVAGLPKPILGVVLGGPSSGARFDDDAANDLAVRIITAKEQFMSLAVTPSRRTPDAFLEKLQCALAGENVYFWDRKGDNPYVEILAHADALIVTADSHNMMSEAVSTGVGVYSYRPKGLVKKLAWFVDELEHKGVVKPFENEAAPFSVAPVNATGEIVTVIKSRLKQRLMIEVCSFKKLCTCRTSLRVNPGWTA